MDFVAVMDILMDADLGLVFSGWIETLEYSGLTRRDGSWRGMKSRLFEIPGWKKKR
jgi:hypothetical protein